MRSPGRVALGAATAVLLAGTAACGGSESGSPFDSRGGDTAPGGDAFEAVAAAAETTQEVTSANFEAVMSSPQSAGGDLEMTGSMSWEPELAMDLTMSGDGLAAAPGMPAEVSVRWVDDVMYMDMGEDFAAEFEGRNWMAMDLMALAQETGDEAVADAMSFGLDSANQDPAQQLALLLESPEIELVGEETLDGVEVSHYRGTISTEDALENGGGAGLLTEEERRRLADAMGEQGIESYHLDVWVDENDLPVRINQSYDTDSGPVEYEVRYSDFGADVTVEAPPAGSVLDFMDLMGELESGMDLG
ncbi:hypothetical protein [Streptomyces litchfieldiae]|uniref:Lipoprotein n=1 Tax=Streptomyces litchfieldiae TaxID=3075543 RepID=A0ABU2MWN9_9ACTN|nr:hypothetical protein [Streptomyces sp. DSM 44938]MDT0346068.1 hypothetical protein [Streptomyces sp. DSM 44938]